MKARKSSKTDLATKVSSSRNRVEPHHSIADWDWDYPDWVRLATERYVSPPSSLSADPGAICRGLCRIPTTLCLPQGQIITYLRADTCHYLLLVFRFQPPLGESLPLLGYNLRLHPDWDATLRLYYDETYHEIGTWPWRPTLETWHRIRLTWWNLSIAPPRQDIQVVLEVQESGVWVNYGAVTHENALYQDSEINRVGLSPTHETIYFDDTEIWGPS